MMEVKCVGINRELSELFNTEQEANKRFMMFLV